MVDSSNAPSGDEFESQVGVANDVHEGQEDSPEVTQKLSGIQDKIKERVMAVLEKIKSEDDLQEHLRKDLAEIFSDFLDEVEDKNEFFNQCRIVIEDVLKAVESRKTSEKETREESFLKEVLDKLDDALGAEDVKKLKEKPMTPLQYVTEGDLSDIGELGKKSQEIREKEISNLVIEQFKNHEMDASLMKGLVEILMKAGEDAELVMQKGFKDFLLAKTSLDEALKDINESELKETYRMQSEKLKAMLQDEGSQKPIIHPRYVSAILNAVYQISLSKKRLVEMGVDVSKIDLPPIKEKGEKDDSSEVLHRLEDKGGVIQAKRRVKIKEKTEPLTQIKILDQLMDVGIDLFEINKLQEAKYDLDLLKAAQEIFLLRYINFMKKFKELPFNEITRDGLLQNLKEIQTNKQNAVLPTEDAKKEQIAQYLLLHAIFHFTWIYINKVLKDRGEEIILDEEMYVQEADDGEDIVLEEDEEKPPEDQDESLVTLAEEEVSEPKLKIVGEGDSDETSDDYHLESAEEIFGELDENKDDDDYGDSDIIIPEDIQPLNVQDEEQVVIEPISYDYDADAEVFGYSIPESSDDEETISKEDLPKLEVIKLDEEEETLSEDEIPALKEIELDEEGETADEDSEPPKHPPKKPLLRTQPKEFKKMGFVDNVKYWFQDKWDGFKRFLGVLKFWK